MAMSNASVVSAVLNGETGRFAELITQYLPMVRGLCRSHVYDASAHDDLVQEVFLDSYRNLGKLRDPNRFGPWLLQIARNKCTSWIRSQTRQMKAHTAYAVDTTREDASGTDVVRRDLYEWVHHQLGGLPSKTREAMVLCYVEGYTVRETASLLGVREGAVKKRLQYGRQQISKRLWDELDDNKPAARDTTALAKQVLLGLPLTTMPWRTAAKAGVMASFWGVLANVKVPLAASCMVAALATLGILHPWEKDAAEIRQEASIYTTYSEGSEKTEGSDLAAREEAGRHPAAHDAIDDLVTHPEPNTSDADIGTALTTMLDAVEKARADMEKALDSPVTIEFEDIHISEILKFMADSWDVTIVLDDDAVAPEGVGVDGSRHDYAIDGTLEHVHLEDVSLLEGLEYMLYPRGLDFVVEPGFVWVSTPEMIAKETTREPDERYDMYDTEDILEQSS
ncbi:MAG TPA: sigma-70 family RNA polymerase sigma factor, partial [Candidatus Hydrogenedentes bacterium]|nr:sigma-70 family RNA polymerase sigma factor [Candidatus Hydrogenedentota bacterium]